jgi:hypothetical protein
MRQFVKDILKCTLYLCLMESPYYRPAHSTALFEVLWSKPRERIKFPDFLADAIGQYIQEETLLEMQDIFIILKTMQDSRPKRPFWR